MKFINKIGKLYGDNGKVSWVTVTNYSDTWNTYTCTETNGRKHLVPARDMDAQFREDEKDYDSSCTCGGAKAKQPSHSGWCDSINNENRRR